jgi:hypothetical protein
MQVVRYKDTISRAREVMKSYMDLVNPVLPEDDRSAVAEMNSLLEPAGCAGLGESMLVSIYRTVISSRNNRSRV